MLPMLMLPFGCSQSISVDAEVGAVIMMGETTASVSQFT